MSQLLFYSFQPKSFHSGYPALAFLDYLIQKFFPQDSNKSSDLSFIKVAFNPKFSLQMEILCILSLTKSIRYLKSVG